jgi:predicted ATPase
VLFRSAGAALRDLGAHRLKDLQAPERVFQLVHPALPAAFPPLRSLDALPNNLPRQLTSFVGRERELAQVRRLLAAAPLLTLTGVGGCGKTRLALQAAADALEAYPDGVWLVELAPLADPALVPQAVAAALGVREEPGRPLAATLTDALTPKRLLLVLDNCEHVLEACARLADALLRACPRLRVLATSREALGIGGETAWRVPSLTLPDAEHPPPIGALLQAEAVRLFIDRALAVRPTFRVTDANAPAVAQICRRLDGIPLAIELAAARVRVLPPGQLLARLEDRFRLLTGGGRTALERHRTLRAAVDWSYDLLTAQEKTLFNRLAVFAGGWTLEAAEAVCAGDGIESSEVLELVTHLADKSLLVVDEQPDGTARYRLLETLRQYARERLAARGEADRIAGEHAAYYLGLAAEVLHEGNRSDRRDAQVGGLRPEFDNLRAALRSCVARGDTARGWQLGAVLGDLWSYWSYFGHPTEGRARLAELMALPTSDGPREASLRAQLLNLAADLAHTQGDFAAVRSYRTEELAIHRQLGNRAGAAYALNALGLAAREEGDLASARRLLQESLAAYRALGDRHGTALTLGRLGTVALAAGDLDTARPLFEESGAIWRAAGNSLLVGWSRLNQGLLELECGNPTGARAAAVESLRLFQGEGHEHALLHSLSLSASQAAALAAAPAAGAAAARAAERALRLGSAIEGLSERLGVGLQPSYRRVLEQWLARASQATSRARVPA